MMIYKFLQLLILSLLISSCLHREFIDGRFELIGITDTILNDSSIIAGYVYHVDGYNDYFTPGEFTILIQEINLFAATDTFGRYSLKTIPGSYTISCESMGNEWQRLIETATVAVGSNQIANIDFYIGYTIE